MGSRGTDRESVLLDTIFSEVLYIFLLFFLNYILSDLLNYILSDLFLCIDLFRYIESVLLGTIFS
jgi:hypothetical protein